MTSTEPPALPFTGDPEVDRLLVDNHFALLIGMLLDQQISIELAFLGPSRLADRVASLDPATLAAMPEDEVVAAFAAKPALHRFPASMGRRARALAQALVEGYDGDAGAIWRGVDDADEVRRRLLALPGFGSEKARIMLAILGKRMGVRPAGWEAACAPFSDDQPRSAADIDSPEGLARVRAWKQSQRAAGRSKQDQPTSAS